jgi:hypothetical protein
MKYTNPLKKLLLLSSLALSFAVHADGTLPLPLEMADPAVDLTMNVSSMSNSPRSPLIANGVQACASTDLVYAATGTVMLESNRYIIKGVCKPKLDTSKRTIVTMDNQSSRFTILEGRADDLQAFTTFTGVLSHKLLGTPGTTVGPEAETSAALAPVRFQLRRP